MEYVQPVAAPDFINLPVDKKDEPKNKQGHVAVSGTVAVAVGSTVAAHELDRSIEVCFADMKTSHLAILYLAAFSAYSSLHQFYIQYNLSLFNIS